MMQIKVRWLFLPLLVAIAAQAQQISSIDRATHIIRGTVEKTEPEMAGGLVPITHVEVRIDRIFKDSDGSLTEGGILKILLYGMETENNLTASADNELTYLKTGHQIIVPLRKYFNNFLLLDKGDPFRLAYVKGNNAAGFDAEGIKTLNLDARKNRYYIEQQRGFEKKEPQRKKALNDISNFEGNGQKSLSEDDFADVDKYSELISAKADFCALKAAFRAPIAAKVKILSLTPTPGPIKGSSKLTVQVLESIKGNISIGNATIFLPAQDDLIHNGIGLPQEGTTGIILLTNSLKPIGFPDFFIPEVNGELKLGRNGKMTPAEFKAKF